MKKQYKKTKTFFSLLFIFITIISCSIIIPYNYQGQSIDNEKANPFGKNKWKMSGKIQYISKMNDTEGYKYHDFGTPAIISLEMKNETKDWIYIILDLDLKGSLKPVGKLEKNRLRFKIRKEDNVAFLDMKNHSENSYKLGFFPFFGYCENNEYSKKIEYMGRISDEVNFRKNTNISYPEKGDPKASRPIGSTIDYVVKEDPITIKEYPMWNNSKPFNKTLMTTASKVYNNKYYQYFGDACIPSVLFFTNNNYTDDFIEIETDVNIKVPVNPDDIDYKNYKFLKTIEMENLYPEKEDESDSDLTPIFMLTVPAVIATGAGYLAYKKQKD